MGGGTPTHPSLAITLEMQLFSKPLVTGHRSPATGLCSPAAVPQIFTQLHSFEYGTRLIRYPDFIPVTT